MPRVKNEDINVMDSYWAARFAPTAGALEYVERYWEARGYDLTRCEPDYDRAVTLNGWTNGTFVEWSAVFVVDDNGERLAVYGYDGSFPYTMTGSDWLERIDGNRLPEREVHHVAKWKAAALLPDFPHTLFADDTDDLLDSVERYWLNSFSLSDDKREEILAALRETGTCKPFTLHGRLDGEIVISTCNCAGHEFHHHYE